MMTLCAFDCEENGSTPLVHLICAVCWAFISSYWLILQITHELRIEVDILQ
jgi:hypothetical protein